VVPKEDLGLAQENDRRRREQRILVGEGGLIKSNAVRRWPKAMRFPVFGVGSLQRLDAKVGVVSARKPPSQYIACCPRVKRGQHAIV
jgi:hypothetical protein